MSIFSGPKAQIPFYTGLQINTSSTAVPVQIVYGVGLTAPNWFWANDFYAIPQHSGGKGGGELTGYDYHCAGMLGLCEGPITGYGAQFINGVQNNPGYGALAEQSFFNGSYSQSPWSFLTSDYPSQALNYKGLAYIATPNMDLGSAASPPAINIEIVGFLAKTGCNGADADPALVIEDFLTNAEYGVGFPSASIDLTQLLAQVDGDGSFQSYCNAAGIAISPILSNQESAASILTRWLQLTNSAAVWSEGLLKIISYGDTPLTGSILSYGANLPYTYTSNVATNQTTAAANSSTVVGTKSFTPVTTLRYALTDDDFYHDDSSSDDPITVQRTDPFSTDNWYTLEICQRGNFYDATPIQTFDQDAVERYGLRMAGTVTAHEICDPNVAQVSAQLILQRGVYIRKTYTFKLSWEYCLLEPMDLVSLTQADCGLNGEVVRITAVEEDENGLLTVTAEEYPAGVATAAEYPVQTKQSGVPAGGIDPGSVNAPIIIEPPGQLSGALQVWAAVSGQNPAVWGGCHVWASWDGVNYTNVGTVSAPARMGVLTANLPSVATTPAGPTEDTTNTLSVDLTESNGTLLSGSAADAENGTTICYVDGEFLSFQNAALVSGNRYNLTTLYRGMFGSQATVGAHASGSMFARLDSAIFKYTYNNLQIGSTIYLKFTSFNLYGGGEQSLADVTAYSHVLSGTPTPNAIDVLTSTLTQVGLTYTLAATWQEDPLAVAYIADISTNGGATWTNIYNDSGLALSLAGISVSNLQLRIAGVNANGVKGPYSTVGVSGAPLQYAPSQNGYVITWDDLSPTLNTILDVQQSLDDLNTSTIGTLLSQAQTNNAIQSSAGAAQAGVTQNSSAIAATNGALASLTTTVSANYGSLSASITTESTARVNGDATNAANISSVAEMLTSVQAISMAGTANGYFYVSATSGIGTGVSAAVGISVSATGPGGTPATASLIVQAMSNGTSQVIVEATNFFVLNGSTATVVFGTNADGSLVLQGVTKVNNVIESVNLTSDGTNPIMAGDFVNGTWNWWA